ncbi:Clp protease N-terminal domain-containing protein [Streptomyces sp. enrichment culture]|uniref:Clp protease N-terminal domain-containing protein n=1 Tax=Streptomyces sp. enrichment culture TaxID=1795815 RepID=UPI003F563556
MHPRIPRQTAREPAEAGTRRADDAAGLSEELAAVVAGARRRALRDGDRQIDTAHLLHSLLESDAEVSEVFGEGPGSARLLGYLVQRSIGYGLRWQTAVEDSGTVPVVSGTAAGLSPLAAACMERAREHAARRGGPARGVDLLAAIVVDPRARAVEVLERAGIDVPGLTVRTEARAADPGRPRECPAGRAADRTVGDGTR